MNEKLEAEELIDFIRSLYPNTETISLHEPQFSGNEKKYVCDAIDTTYVSSIGDFVGRFEGLIKVYTGACSSVATVNGTSALHSALYLSGVQQGDFVITQPLTFVATCNAIAYLKAEPIFCDVSPVTLGLCPQSVEQFLENHAVFDGKLCRHKDTGRKIAAMMPMHTFGHPAQIYELLDICKSWGLTLVEDAAESLGSQYKNKHTGTFGKFGAFSFNGNKIITTGGGGMLLARDEEDGKLAKHVTSTARLPHSFEFFHDQIGFNYRMPNLNAALGCAQIERISDYIKKKRELAKSYQKYFQNSDSLSFIEEPPGTRSNYWLNAVVCQDEGHRDYLISTLNEKNIGARPIWKLMNQLPMYRGALSAELANSDYFGSRVVCLPSSPPSLDKLEI